MIFLITGDQGFIGSNLKKLLQKKKLNLLQQTKKILVICLKKKAGKKYQNLML